jgi:uncharacterized protein YjiS (DUF1127 family)
MNAPTAKSQTEFTLGNLSYIGGSYEDGPVPLVTPRRHVIGPWVARALARIAAWRRRRAVMYELATMTDRELADIGLSRYDISRVFDPAFVADRTRERFYTRS